MVLKAIKYILLIVISVVWIVGCNPNLSQINLIKLFIKDSYRFGDLYRFSNLPQYKELQQRCTPTMLDSTQAENINLFVIGDSFTEKERIDSSFFKAKYFKRVHWNEHESIGLSDSKTNILIIETVERHFREHFAVGINNFSTFEDENLERPSILKQWENKQAKIEEALQNIWLASDIAFWFKEKKALLNYLFFDRVDNQVVLTADKKNILFSWESEPNRITSSFNPLSDEEVDSLVSNINTTAEKYKKMGFDEVCLSVIPNKTSIVAPEMGVYNHLIERVENNKNLKVPIISVWKEFNTNKEKTYLHSDTHWTCFGQNIWVKKVNDLLVKH